MKPVHPTLHMFDIPLLKPTHPLPIPFKKQKREAVNPNKVRNPIPNSRPYSNMSYSFTAMSDSKDGPSDIIEYLRVRDNIYCPRMILVTETCKTIKKRTLISPICPCLVQQENEQPNNAD